MAREYVGHTYVRTSHFMTFLHEADFRPASCQCRASNRVSLLTWQTGRILDSHFFLTFHVNRPIYLLLNFNLNSKVRKICQKSRDEGKENNNGKGGETL